MLGAAFLIAGIVCLLLACQWGGTAYPWNDSRVYGLIIGFGVLSIIFIYLQFKMGEKATIPPRVFLKRTVWSSSLFSCLMAMGLYT
jgi:hypothetical protein